MIIIQNPLTFNFLLSAQTVRSYLRSAFFRYRDDRLFRRLRLGLSDRLRLARRKHLDSDPVFCRDEGCGGRGSRRFFALLPDKRILVHFNRRRV